MKSMETDKERQKRLANTRQNVTKRKAKESVEKTQERLDKNRLIKRKAYNIIRCNKADNERQIRLAKMTQNVNKQRTEERPEKRNENLQPLQTKSPILRLQ